MAKNFNHKSKRYAKNRVKMILAIVAAALCGALVMGFCLNTFREKTVNPNNLIKQENYLNTIEETSMGLKIKWNDDGTFALNGKHDDEDLTSKDLYKHAFVTVELEPGEYTISTGNEHCSEDTYGIYYILGGETVLVGEKSNSFTVEEKTNVDIGFFVKNDTFVLYAKLAPVLVTGGTAQDYYID